MADLRPEVTFVGHASVAMDLGGMTVITDPVLTNRVKHLRRMTRQAPRFDPGTVDVVVVSHQHHDHFHIPSLKRLPRSAHVIVPRGLGPTVGGLGFEQISEVTVGDRVDIERLSVTAVPAVHDDRRHPGADRVEPLGFLFDVDGWSVYFPGDTELFDGMADIDEHLDLALIPVWGWGPTLGGGHLDPIGAADALEMLTPRLALPIHWGTLWPYHVQPNDRLVLPPKELARAVAERQLPIEVIEIAPGSAAIV